MMASQASMQHILFMTISISCTNACLHTSSVHYGTPTLNGWSKHQTHIPLTKKMYFLSCLLHYDMRVANVMRYVGHNYTRAYRNILNRVEAMKHLVNPDLLQHYMRAVTIGAPVQFNNSTTRKNALLHWQMGNHPSVIQNMTRSSRR